MRPGWLAFCVGALVVSSAVSALAAPAYVITTVNLRAGAGTSHEIIAKIPAGSRVEAANCKDGWCEVSWQGKNGFAIQTALDLSGRPPRPRSAYRPPPGYYVEGPPIYYAPPLYYYGPPYYGPPYYYGPYWRRRWWWYW
jgi:uncharacterized protein YraI